MTYFQNVSQSQFTGCLSLGDSRDSISFKIAGNKNTSNLLFAYNSSPYDLSGDSVLKINFSFDREYHYYTQISVDVAGDTASATTAQEICLLLNEDSNFSDWFTAEVTAGKVSFRPKREDIKIYISNTGAETVLGFNKMTGVADIPSIFEKDTIENKGPLIRLSHEITNISDDNPSVITSENHGLTSGDVIYIVGSNSTPSVDGEQTVTVIDGDTFSVPVNGTTPGNTGEWLSTVEKNVVENAGLDYSEMFADWEHLRGRTSTFLMTKNTIDDSDRITEQLFWFTGAKAGNMAKKTIYSYTSDNKNPDSIMELPYVLKEEDLISP